MKSLHSQLLNVFLLLVLGFTYYQMNRNIDAAYSHYPEIAAQAHKEGYKLGYDKGAIQGWKDATTMCFAERNK